VAVILLCTVVGQGEVDDRPRRRDLVGVGVVEPDPVLGEVAEMHVVIDVDDNGGHQGAVVLENQGVSAGGPPVERPHYRHLPDDGVPLQEEHHGALPGGRVHAHVHSHGVLRS
jgi:hypothetical protein